MRSGIIPRHKIHTSRFLSMRLHPHNAAKKQLSNKFAKANAKTSCGGRIMRARSSNVEKLTKSLAKVLTARKPTKKPVKKPIKKSTSSSRVKYARY